MHARFRVHLLVHLLHMMPMPVTVGLRRVAPGSFLNAFFAQPNGWEYFSLPDKVDYLAQYAVGREYECWARPNTGYHEVTFSTNQKDLKRLIPQVSFDGCTDCILWLKPFLVRGIRSCDAGFL